MGGFAPATPTAATTAAGVRDTVRIDGAESLVRDVSADIEFETPEAAPFLGFTKIVRGKRTVTNSEFEWKYVPDYPKDLQVTAAATAAATQIVVAAGEWQRLHRGMQLMNSRTGETCIVGGAAEPTSVTIDIACRAGAQAMEAGDALRIIGTAKEENSEKFAIRSQTEQTFRNYIQIHETGWGLTDLARNSSSYMGNEAALERKKAMVRHNQEKEEILLNGIRYQNTTGGVINGSLVQYTGGMKFWAQSNVWKLGGNRPTETQFMDYLGYLSQYGPGGYERKGGAASKVILYSPAWSSLLDSWFKNKVQYEQISDKLGVKVGFVQSSAGEFMLKLHPMFGRPGYRDKLMVLDLGLLRYVDMKGLDTTIAEGVETPGSSRKENLIRSYFGLEAAGDERAHGWVEGLGLAA
jgi:hypothetical protein